MRNIHIPARLCASVRVLCVWVCVYCACIVRVGASVKVYAGYNHSKNTILSNPKLTNWVQSKTTLKILAFEDGSWFFTRKNHAIRYSI